MCFHKFKQKLTESLTLGIEKDKKKYNLDVAAIGFSLISNKRITNVFRISCTLKDQVDVNKLQSALTNILPRFPYFRVSIKKGFIWGKLVTNLSIPKIESESEYPCQYMPFGQKSLLFRFFVENNKISLEFHHCLTDGYGGLVFLNSLIAEYFRITGLSLDDWNDVLLAEEKPDLQEFEDSYNRYDKKEIKLRADNFHKRNFYLPYEIEPPGIFHLLNVIFSLESIKQKAKEYDVTITSFLVAIYYESLKELQEKICSENKKRIKPISIRIPVNLRNILPSTTLRNFSSTVRLDLDPRKESRSFRELVKQIDAFLKNKIQKETFYNKIARNSKTANLFIMHLIPFQIKRFIARTFY